MSTKPSKEILDTMAKDPGNWHGVFYFNRKDYRIMVPKIYPMMGWTVNFGNPYSWLAISGFIIIIVIFSVFLK